MLLLSFFFISPSTTDIYTLSLHDALPICFSTPPSLMNRRREIALLVSPSPISSSTSRSRSVSSSKGPRRSEEHTSELQSRGHLVCRLLLEKKKTTDTTHTTTDHPI